MDLFGTIIAGFGLSAPAGLNAWLPLLIVGLAGRFHFITLKSPFDVLTNTWVLVVLAILLLIEIFVDKIPAADTVNDVIHTFIRPVAGGILFAAQSGIVGGHIDPAFAFILGLLSAGSVHAVKATARPLITATTGGIGNPLVSFVEDLVSGVSAALALIFPILIGLILLIAVGLVFFFVWRWRERRRRRRQVQI